ncbi:hypothetical protein Tco_0814044 [Tanacetum coccineum]
MLKRPHSSKVAGKARHIAESSPIDNMGGISVVSTLVNDTINKIKKPIINNQSDPVAKSSGLKTNFEHTDMGDVGSTSFDLASSKDGLAIAKTGIDCDLGMAGPRTSNEHTSMEDVVSTGVVHSSSLDGIASNKVGSSFEFGRLT